MNRRYKVTCFLFLFINVLNFLSNIRRANGPIPEVTNWLFSSRGISRKEIERVCSNYRNATRNWVVEEGGWSLKASIIDWRDWSHVSNGKSLHFADKRVPLFLHAGFMLSWVAVLINTLASDKRKEERRGKS